jgi:hypothetical protein
MPKKDDPRPKPPYEALLAQAELLEPFLTLAGGADDRTTEALESFRREKATLTEGLENLGYFGRVYAPRGWTLYDDISLPLLAQLRTLEPAEAEIVLTDHFMDSHRLKRLGYRFIRARYANWQALAERAFERLAATDFVSAIPLLLIVIDGVCQRHIQKSAFGGATDQDVFDTLTSAPNGLAESLRLAGKTRKKVSAEPLDTPYRNGIMHGRDVNFGHAIVAAKSVNLLHAVLNYIDRLSDEEERIAKAAEDQRPPDWAAILSGHARTQAISEAIDGWAARPPLTGVFASYENSAGIVDGTPEAAVVGFLKAMAHRNFGKLADLTHDLTLRSKEKWAGDLRRDNGDLALQSWRLTSLADTAASVSVVRVEVAGAWKAKAWRGAIDLRTIYVDDANDILPRDFGEGRWQLLPSAFWDMWRLAYG